VPGLWLTAAAAISLTATLFAKPAEEDLAAEVTSPT
jgi:hypothetical protein